MFLLLVLYLDRQSDWSIRRLFDVVVIWYNIDDENGRVHWFIDSMYEDEWIPCEEIQTVCLFLSLVPWLVLVIGIIS